MAEEGDARIYEFYNEQDIYSATVLLIYDYISGTGSSRYLPSFTSRPSSEVVENVSFEVTEFKDLSGNTNTDTTTTDSMGTSVRIDVTSTEISTRTITRCNELIHNNSEDTSKLLVKYGDTST